MTDFDLQLQRISEADVEGDTKRIARKIHEAAVQVLGRDASVFWDYEDNTISFETEKGVITVGGPP
jgi:hypothetical protein